MSRLFFAFLQRRNKRILVTELTVLESAPAYFTSLFFFFALARFSTCSDCATIPPACFLSLFTSFLSSFLFSITPQLDQLHFAVDSIYRLFIVGRRMMIPFFGRDFILFYYPKLARSLHDKFHNY